MSLKNSSCTRDLHFELLTPSFGQVLPRRILCSDQRDSLSPSPRFDLLLASDGVAYLMEYLVINEPVNVVSLREALDFSALVLQGPPIDVICDSGVEVSMIGWP